VADKISYILLMPLLYSLLPIHYLVATLTLPYHYLIPSSLHWELLGSLTRVAW